MEVKFFVGDNLQQVEQHVNGWLHTTGADIKHITQSQSEKNGRFVFVITIFFMK